MRALVVTPCLDGTGWSRAGVEAALALDAAGVEVAVRPLKLNGHQAPAPERLRQLIARPSQGCDVALLHCLPHHLAGNYLLRSACLFASETSDFRATSWAPRLQMVDEAWVVNAAQGAACAASGVTRPVRVVPHASDPAAYARSYPVPRELVPLKKSGAFLFGFAGELVRRKNLPALLQAFHVTFRPEEPVKLVVKTSLPGRSPAEAEAECRKACDQVRDGLKLPRRRQHEPVVVTRRYTDDEMFGLAAAVDCHVMPSCGEAWGWPAFDAMALGRGVVAADRGGHLDYLSAGEGWLVESRLSPCFGAFDTFRDLYTGQEAWASVDVLALGRAMREAYEDRALLRKKGRRGVARALDFSREKVGALMRGHLHALAGSTERGPGADGP